MQQLFFLVSPFAEQSLWINTLNYNVIHFVGISRTLTNYNKTNRTKSA